MGKKKKVDGILTGSTLTALEHEEPSGFFMVQTKLVQSHQHRESRERKKKKQKQKHRERRNRPPVERPKFPTRVAMHEVMQL